MNSTELLKQIADAELRAREVLNLLTDAEQHMLKVAVVTNGYHKAMWKRDGSFAKLGLVTFYRNRRTGEVIPALTNFASEVSALIK